MALSASEKARRILIKQHQRQANGLPLTTNMSRIAKRFGIKPQTVFQVKKINNIAIKWS